MNSINIKKLDKNFDLTLCKVNKDTIGTILPDYLDSVTRSINDIDTLELTIPLYVTNQSNFEQIKNPIYNDIKDERLICLNNKEYFVIKEDTFASDSKNKKIKAYSREYKLGKIDINIEDIGFYLNDKDEELGIYSLNEYMKQETGWSFGHIDDTVQYNIDADGNKTNKLRWQESISMRWYDFLMQNISESFGCILTFNTDNKTMNLFDIKTSGEEIQIYLSNDNYLKSLERVDNSTEIVTRLYLVGNEEMDIIGATHTGYPYLENFSYFIENEEMSSNLTSAILKYQEMLVERRLEWNKLVDLKTNKTIILRKKQDDLYILYEEIKALKSMLKHYDALKDEINKAKIAAEITKKEDLRVPLEKESIALEKEIEALQSSIDEINKLCKRETAIDENGLYIFNEDLLDELKEFVYCETYTNDSFLEVEDLIEAGKRNLELRCKPTSSYTLNVVDFTKRVIDTGFRQHWNGELSLGDIVMLYDEDLNEEVLQFFVGYTLRPNEVDGLDLEISNKKVREDYTRTIADYLQEAKRSMNMVNNKKYLWNKQKYNRINL